MSVPLGSWYKTYEGHGEKNQNIAGRRLQRKGKIEMQVRVTKVVGEMAAQHDKIYWKNDLIGTQKGKALFSLTRRLSPPRPRKSRHMH